MAEPGKSTAEEPVAGPGGEPEDRRLDGPAGLGLGGRPGRPDHPPPGHQRRLPHPARPGGRHQPHRDRAPRRARRRRARARPRAPGSWCTPSPSSSPAAGTLSLRADEIRQVGVGELLARLERLKKLLAAEGLFDPARKRRLPFLPGRIGLITGRASAAERDVLDQRPPALAGGASSGWSTSPSRAPSAVPQIIDALAVLDRDPAVDVIIMARGGGSVEDLLPFSDEALCRAVFACRTPVISRDRPRDRHARWSTSSPTCARPRRPTPPSGRCRTSPTRSGCSQRARARLRPGRAQPARPGAAAARRPAQPAGAGPPRTRARRTVGAGRGAARPGRAGRCGHRLDRAGTELHHTLARLRALSPAATLERGYAIVQRGSRRRGAALTRPMSRSGDALRRAPGRR